MANQQRGSDEGGHEQEHGGMGARGISRPSAEMEQQKHQQKQQHDDADMRMDEESRRKMLQMHHRQVLWMPWTVVALGFWVLVAPFTFGYASATVEPSGGRDVWLSLQGRITAMTLSDILSGLALIVFGWRSLTPNRPISQWGACLVGIWLNVAPVLFWAPTAAAYYNGTLVGALIIALTVLAPGMPNMIMFMKMGPPVPPGWTYNPSSWPQRWIMIALGFAGWMVSRYLAAFQLGYTETVWEPFFGDGTRNVLNSRMSHMWPISDGALGALAYTFEFLMGWMGSTSRWRTMPWMVAIFGILVIPLGLTHIILVISQPLVVGSWCTFCLVAAAIMLPMIPLEVDEVIAMVQHMRQAKRRGENLWQVFWKGGSPEGCTPDNRSPRLMDLPHKPGAVVRASVWGMSVPWTLLLTTALGIWLMFTPTVLGMREVASHLTVLAGALTVTVSVICMGEPLRLGRFINIAFGLTAGLVPFLAQTPVPVIAKINGVVVGLGIIALSVPRGPVREHYGAWDRLVR